MMVCCLSREKFEPLALVLLPDHLHCIWKLPEGDSAFSVRWACVKKRFTQLRLASGQRQERISKAREHHRERSIWQRRFWEHTIRDETDFIRHVNYIHYNPVKHSLVECPHHWAYSSFHQWVTQGYYDTNWLCTCDGRESQQPDFQEIEYTVGE
jgi:putative transposase